MDALRICREVVSHLNWKKTGDARKKEPLEPVYSQEELLGLISEDLKSPVDIREVIARFVDGKLVTEGEKVVIGGDKYKVYCRKHYRKLTGLL